MIVCLAASNDLETAPSWTLAFKSDGSYASSKYLCQDHSCANDPDKQASELQERYEALVSMLTVKGGLAGQPRDDTYPHRCTLILGHGCELLLAGRHLSPPPKLPRSFSVNELLQHNRPSESSYSSCDDQREQCNCQSSSCAHYYLQEDQSGIADDARRADPIFPAFAPRSNFATIIPFRADNHLFQQCANSAGDANRKPGRERARGCQPGGPHAVHSSSVRE